MAAFELIVCIIAAVVLSSFLSRFIPKVSTPLVQIALGALASQLPFFPNVTLDPELFMVLFIAPLLYLEAHEIDKSELLKSVTLSLSLAIGLAIATMVAVGFALHAVWPAIPLAAALALGAALGPTDAVAVSSLGKEAALTQRQTSVLKGESLFNDASGIVGFQFAIAAAVSGVFTVGDSAAQFVFSFFGGAIFGLAVGMVADLLFESLRSFGWETTTSRILMELFLPFILYLGAEAVHVSGILSVVTAGLIIRFDRTGIGPNVARTNIVSSSVWGVVLVHAQRHGVHSAWHVAAECDERKLGRSASQQLAATGCDSYGFRSGNHHAIPVDFIDATSRARYRHRQATQDDGATLAFGRGHDVRRAERHHHPVIDVHDPVHHYGRRVVPHA